jgi:hypothetical protein
MDAQQELVVAEFEVQRAKAAVAAEQREKDKTALREGIERGRALKAEYERVSSLFYDARAEADALEGTRRSLDARAAELRTSEPYTNDVFASEREQARWEKESARVAKDLATVLGQARIACGNRDRYQLDAVRAGQALDHHTQVVRNLKQKLEDPEGNFMRKGPEGGVFEPFTGTRVNL